VSLGEAGHPLTCGQHTFGPFVTGSCGGFKYFPRKPRPSKPPGCGSSRTHGRTYASEKVGLSRAFALKLPEMMSDDAKFALGY
jgi:hypothetical protein